MFIIEVFEEHEIYKRYVIALAIIYLFGLLSNPLNIAVLARKQYSTPVKVTLLGLVAVEMVMIVFNFAFYITEAFDLADKEKYGHLLFSLVCNISTLLTRDISNALTVILVIWTYKLSTSAEGEFQDFPKKEKRVLLITVVACAFLNIPRCLFYEIKAQHSESKTQFYISYTDLAFRNNFIVIYLWIYDIAVLFIECILVLAFCAALMKKSLKNHQRSMKSCARLTFGLSALFLITTLTAAICFLLILLGYISIPGRLPWTFASCWHSLKFLVFYLFCQRFRKELKSLICLKFNRASTDPVASVDVEMVE